GRSRSRPSSARRAPYGRPARGSADPPPALVRATSQTPRSRTSPALPSQYVALSRRVSRSKGESRQAAPRPRRALRDGRWRVPPAPRQASSCRRPAGRRFRAGTVSGAPRRPRAARRPALLAARPGPEVDVALGGVLVDLGQLILGEVEPLERADVGFQLLDAACAGDRGSHARVPERPCQGHLRKRLAPRSGELVQRADLR